MVPVSLIAEKHLWLAHLYREPTINNELSEQEDVHKQLFTFFKEKDTLSFQFKTFLQQKLLLSSKSYSEYKRQRLIVQK